MTNLKLAGQGILDVEISHVSAHGIWLLSENQEFFLSYDDFPWFKTATLQKILAVEQPRRGHFYWPELDIDLSLEMIKEPKKFPLVAS